MSNALTVTAPETLPFIDLERDFDAPVAALFAAHRDPELLEQWLGPNGYQMKIDHYDFVPGGSWRYRHITPQGEFGFHGVFHAVRENEFAIQTFEFEGAPDIVSIESVTFTDLGAGRTRLSVHAAYPSLEARNAMIAGGMERGIREGYERLESLVTSGG
jgi:uncharacterized protein YndB with AHSA1/START domain